MKQKRWPLVLENISLESAALTGSRFGSNQNSSGVRALVFLILVLFLSRAFFLQVVLGARNQVLAEGNRIENRRVEADRGVITDRQDRVLARNGLDEEGNKIREYPYGQTGAHVLGYVGLASPEDIQRCQTQENCQLLAGEMVGKLGIERTYDQILRGNFGERLVETNASGQELRIIGQKNPVAGRNLKLNLDMDLTKHITQVLAARDREKPTRGAVVVSRAGSNEILALVSWPGFDPNLFTGQKVDGPYLSPADVLADKENLPLFNRASAGAYPPGSIYKLVTATAGLETGGIDQDTLVEDTGELKVGDFRFGTWNFDQHGQKEGDIGLIRALARSNDIFFYKTGEWAGVEQLRLWSEKLGLGKKTGIELGSEVSGLVPDPVLKERQTGERWFLGNTYHMSIGQGDLLATPLQLNRMTAAVVSGQLCPARLELGDSREGCQEVGLSRQHRKLILEGMIQACAQGGTAFPFFQFEPAVACKTGTAQHGGEKTEPHALITVVIPTQPGTELGYFERGVVITILLEEAGEGSYEAGPVAKTIAEYLISHQL